MIYIRKVILMVFGMVSTILGWAIWQEPHLDFDVLITLMTNEVFRLAGDPFAILGVMLMLLGFWTLFMVLLGPWPLPYKIDEIMVPSTSNQTK